MGLGTKLSVPVLQHSLLSFVLILFFSELQEPNYTACFGPYLPEASRKMNI